MWVRRGFYFLISQGVGGLHCVVHPLCVPGLSGVNADSESRRAHRNGPRSYSARAVRLLLFNRACDQKVAGQLRGDFGPFHHRLSPPFRLKWLASADIWSKI